MASGVPVHHVIGDTHGPLLQIVDRIANDRRGDDRGGFADSLDASRREKPRDARRECAAERTGDIDCERRARNPLAAIHIGEVADDGRCQAEADPVELDRQTHLQD